VSDDDINSIASLIIADCVSDVSTLREMALVLARARNAERARAERAEAEVRALRAAWPAADDDCRTDGILDWDERGWWVVHANDSLGPYPTRDAAIDAAAGIDRGEAK
jgi:hypothetical protein